MVLNMLTTGAMIQLGKTYGNMMVDLPSQQQTASRKSLSLGQVDLPSG
jgi:N-acetylmuramic acid 6-phosphate etherase